MSDFPTSAAKAIIEKDGTLLLLQRPEGNWDLPGGLIEEGEESSAALMREVEEETALKVEVRGAAGSWSFVRSLDGKTVLVDNHYCRLIDNSREPTLSSEHIAYRWVQREDLGRYVFKDASLLRCLERDTKRP